MMPDKKTKHDKTSHTMFMVILAIFIFTIPSQISAEELHKPSFDVLGLSPLPLPSKWSKEILSANNGKKISLVVSDAVMMKEYANIIPFFSIISYAISSHATDSTVIYGYPIDIPEHCESKTNEEFCGIDIMKSALIYPEGNNKFHGYMIKASTMHKEKVYDTSLSEFFIKTGDIISKKYHDGNPEYFATASKLKGVPVKFEIMAHTLSWKND